MKSRQKPYNPKDVVFPKSRFRSIKVLHDGVANGDEFSFAEINLHSGKICYGVRHNISYWNEDNPGIGYPTCRPGNPTWFILPDVENMLPIMNELWGKQ